MGSRCFGAFSKDRKHCHKQGGERGVQGEPSQLHAEMSYSVVSWKTILRARHVVVLPSICVAAVGDLAHGSTGSHGGSAAHL